MQVRKIAKLVSARPSKGNVFDPVCLRNDMMRAKLSTAVLEK